MKKNSQADYGIFIDHLHAFLVSVNDDSTVTLEFTTDVGLRIRFDGEGSSKMSEGDHTVNRDKKHQDKLNEDFHKFCKLIVEKIDNPHRILVFGPSNAKYELQKEIKDTKRLHGVSEEIKTTDKMSEGETVRFVAEHFGKVLKA